MTGQQHIYTANQQSSIQWIRIFSLFLEIRKSKPVENGKLVLYRFLKLFAKWSQIHQNINIFLSLSLAIMRRLESGI